jgi:hypothetical protein
VPARSVSFDRAAGYYDATRALPDGARAALVDEAVRVLRPRGVLLSRVIQWWAFEPG